MTSAVAAPPAGARPAETGSQKPRIRSVPRSASAVDADDAMEIVALAGLELDPWQEMILRDSLGLREDGKWSAFEVGIVCPRQNGKNEILMARELIGLFMLEERVIIHSAHMADTAMEAFRRLEEVIEETPEFRRKLKPRGIKHGHGFESIELKTRQRITFRTRGGKKGGARGFTSDLLVFDECMDLSEHAHGAILPTLSARPNPQVFYTGSAVDQWVHENGLVFARVRERGLAGDDPSLAFFEWSIEADGPEWVDDEVATDPQAWAESNPGFAIRIAGDYIAHEQRSLDPRTFAVERLGVGDWPSTDPEEDQVISGEAWAKCSDPKSEPGPGLVFAFDVAPDRSSAAIGVASQRPDGKVHAEVIEHGHGTGWVPERLKELEERHRPNALVCDEKSPAASLLARCEELGLKIETVNASEHAQACGRFYDAVEDDALRHLDQAELKAALRGAATRPLSDAWAWSRKNSTVDITPLVACTLAVGHSSLVLSGREWYARNRIELL